MSLQNAVKSHDLAQVKVLLEQGADVNQRFEDGCTALMIAAMLGDKPIARSLVKAGARVNLKNTQGDTAIILAARAGYTAICEYLSILTEPSERQRAEQILASQQPSRPSPQEQANALVVAAGNGDLAGVDFLLTENVDVNATSNEIVNKSKTALYAAARNGHVEIVRRLIQAGANLNQSVEKDDLWAGMERQCPKCRTQFTSVQDYGTCPNCGHKFYASLPDYDPEAPKPDIWDSAIVDESQSGIRTTTIPPKAIQEHQSPPRPQPWRDHTPLMGAVRVGHLEVVKVLVAAGASLEANSWYTRSPLHLAIIAGQYEIVQCLIAAGAVLDRFEGSMNEAKTPLMLAIAQEDSEMIEILLQASANVNAKGQFNDNALTLAAEIGNDAIIQRLQAARANQEGLAAISLRAAAQRGDVERVRTLLKTGVDPNQPDFRNNTALIQAAFKGHLNVVEVLLEAGADVNQNNHVYTPLTAATYYGHTEVVKRLIEAGADVNWSNSMMGNALDCAQNYAYQEIVELLLAAGAVNSQDDGENEY